MRRPGFEPGLPAFCVRTNLAFTKSSEWQADVLDQAFPPATPLVKFHLVRKFERRLDDRRALTDAFTELIKRFRND